MTGDTHHLVETARSLVAPLRSRRDEIESARRVPADIASDLAKAGFYRMLVPRSLGGEEVDPRVFVEVLETLASGDSAVAWCTMTGATTGIVTAYLGDDAASEIWADSGATLAGVFAPTGKSTPVDGGYRLSGRWPFASGSENATWRMGGAIIDGAVHACFFGADESSIVDTWNVSGLRGTGSHDLVVEDIFVPSRRVVAMVGAIPAHSGALYAFPVFGLLALGVTAVGLGIARAAIDDLGVILTEKPGRGRRRAEDTLMQVAYARAEGRLRAARALVFRTLDAVWDRARALDPGSSMTDLDRAELRLAATDAAELAVEAVDGAYHAAGGRAIYTRSPLQRHFRDAHTMTQHMMIAPATRKLIGRVLLGVPSDTSQL